MLEPRDREEEDYFEQMRVLGEYYEEIEKEIMRHYNRV